MVQLPPTRHSLLLQLRADQHDAWDEFLSIYQGAIIRWARRRGLQEADAHDVCQEVLAAVQKKIDHWRPGVGSFRGWLFRVSRNLTIDRIRSLARQTSGSGDPGVTECLQQHPGPDHEAADEFSLEYRRGVFRWAAQRIRPTVKSSSWQAFWQTAIEGRPAEDVAATLGLSVGSVYTAKYRIVARLQEAVKFLEQADSHVREEVDREVEQVMQGAIAQS